MQVKHDRKLLIAIGRSRKASQWQNKEMMWSEFLDKLATTTRTRETVTDYAAMSKADRVLKLKAKQIPHMGWNIVNTDDPLMDGIKSRHFYFAHSYYCEPVDRSLIMATTEYEGITIPTMFRKKNFIGTQFHPEKSSTSGLQFISNFVKFAEECL